MTAFTLRGTDGALRILELAGREEWALSHLLAARTTGCTSISHPDPRWSDYVFKLRRRGVDITTLAEHHDGPFAGTHGRYILRGKVERLGAMEMAA
jgi:hypothetical protein